MSHPRKLLHIVALLMLAATPIACGLSTGNNPRRATASVVVFEDRDADGSQDPGEAGIVNVLVAGTTNQHGFLNRTAERTGADGEATIEGTTTHIFRIAVVPPCGYRATTPIDVNAESLDEVAFGFAPEDPHPESATITFVLWHDQDEDGIQDSEEPVVEGVTLHTNPWEPDWERMPSSHAEDDLGITTDSDGRATLELGPSCGILWIPEPEEWRTTSTTPTARRQPGGEGLPDWLAFPYGPGSTEIAWGLTR
jgi:hypothetical protein